jgi:response regulator NasT
MAVRACSQTTKTLRLALTDEDADISDVLESCGHTVSITTERNLEAYCRAQRPDLVLGHDAVSELCDRLAVPWILIASADDPPHCEPFSKTLMAVLYKPVKKAELCTAVAFCMVRFEELKSLTDEVAQCRQILEDRKVTERAKGIIMTMLGLGEEQAYRRMRDSASRQNRKLTDVAREIIQAEAPFRELRDPETR